MLKRQKGFFGLSPLVMYAIYAAVVVAALWGAYAYVNTHWETRAGIARGKEVVQGQWDAANQKEKARQGREAAVRETVTTKQEAAHATALASLDARYRAALRSVRQPAVNNQPAPLSDAASSFACPDRQADAVGRLERLEEGVLGLLERGDKAIARTIVAKEWLEQQGKVVVE